MKKVVKAMTNYINQEVINLLKNGADPYVIQSKIAEGTKSFSKDFVSFMQDMLDKYHIKRTEIARRSGISQDYLYKVLNGSKKTAEKDYVIAICIAIGMNVPETQHALKINGLALLDDRDLRERILLTCISEQRGVFKTNAWLEKAGFPELRVSKDMEEYIPHYDFSEEEASINNVVNAKKKKYKEVDREISAERCGHAPYDYSYLGKIVVEDENSDRFYVYGYYSPLYSFYAVIDEKSYIDNNLAEEFEELDMVATEKYDDIEDAVDSDFFRYFLEIDKATDDKVKEVLSDICETANYGKRFGCKIVGGKTISYAEQYDAEHPAARQYFQVVETDGQIVYSASHESVFMWIEMGDIYSAIFDNREEPKYFIYIENEEDLADLPMREHFIFDALKLELHAYANQNFKGFVEVNDLTVLSEEINSLAQMATWKYIHEEYEESLDYNKQLLEIAEKCESEYNTDELSTILHTLLKISRTYGELGNDKASEEWRERIFAYHDRVMENLEECASVYATALMDKIQAAQGKENVEALKNYCKETISLLEPNCQNEDDAETLFIAYTLLSFWLDEENRSDIAIEYYEKAEKLLRVYHLDQKVYWRNIATFYNNYAWVLWNRFENEEAIIYYGKAIDIAENKLYDKDRDQENARECLKHYANELYKLYIQTSKEKEANHLKKRMKEYEIKLNK